MNRERWNDLVNENELRTLTLTLEQRNAIWDASEYLCDIERQVNRVEAQRDALLAACERILAIAENKQPGTWDDVMLTMRAAIAQARAGEEG